MSPNFDKSLTPRSDANIANEEAITKVNVETNFPRKLPSGCTKAKVEKAKVRKVEKVAKEKGNRLHTPPEPSTPQTQAWTLTKIGQTRGNVYKC